MRKIILLMITIALILVGCSSDEDNNVEVSNEATIRGIVQEVNSDTILMESKDRIHSGLVQVSQRVEKNEKTIKDLKVGDEIVVHYDGYISESEPAIINGVKEIEISKESKGSNEDDYYSLETLSVVIGSESRELTEKQSALVHDLINDVKWDRGIKDDSEDNYTVMEGKDVLFTFNSKTGVLNDSKNDISVKLNKSLSSLLKEVLDDEF